MASFLYTNYKLKLGQKAEAFNADAFKCALFTSSYTPAPDTDTTYTGISANEVAAANGYTTGGMALASVTWGTLAANSYGGAWAGSTPYTLGQLVRPAVANGYLYKCVTAGTSGAGPTWGTTIANPGNSGTALTTDNTVTWECVATTLVKLSAANLSLTVTGVITYRYAVVYDSTTGDLVACFDPGGSQSGPSSGTLNINWDANAGIAVFY